MNKLLNVLIVILTALTIGAAQASEVIKVGAIFAKTGEAAEENLVIFQALRFAVEEINSQGGLLGKQVQLLEYDNHSTPIQSLLAAKQAVKDDVVAVIGASWSTHSLAIAPYLQKMQIPMISPDSTNPKVTQIGDYIFRACITDNEQGKILAQFAIDSLKSRDAVVLQNINSDYSIGLTDIFDNNFNALGGKVTAIYNYKSEQTDFTDLLEQVKALNPDLLFIPGYAESGYIVKQAKNMGIEAAVLGGDTWAYKEFYAHGGQDLKEGYYSAHWNKNIETKEARDFVARYSKLYDVTDFAAAAYDAITILFNAIDRADSLARPKIRDALAATKDFNGVTGNITIDSNGDAEKPIVMMKITNGRADILKVIKPD